MLAIFVLGATATRDFSGRFIRNDQFWLDDVQCVGTESRLIDCPARPVGQHNCFYSFESIVISCPPIGNLFCDFEQVYDNINVYYSTM